MDYDLITLDQRAAAGIWELPQHPEFQVDFSDQRGRVFKLDLFVAGGPEQIGLFVWGVSQSGATKIVAWPRRSRTGRRGHSPLRRAGWTNLDKAEAVVGSITTALLYLEKKKLTV